LTSGASHVMPPPKSQSLAADLPSAPVNEEMDIDGGGDGDDDHGDDHGFAEILVVLNFNDYSLKIHWQPF
jgi:hypothetical protein